MVTLYPLDCNSLANDADMIPLPKEEVTPPVTKMYFTESIREDLIKNLWDTKVHEVIELNHNN